MHTTTRSAMSFVSSACGVYSYYGQFTHHVCAARHLSPNRRAMGARGEPDPCSFGTSSAVFQKPQRQFERMAGDISKHLDRAKRFLEKNRVEDAIEAYLAVLEEAPQHQEATQALGDLYARIEQPDRAAVYYGMLFDLLVEPRDEIKALAIYNRFLRLSPLQQPPERIARYAFLQQK